MRRATALTFAREGASGSRPAAEIVEIGGDEQTGRLRRGRGPEWQPGDRRSAQPPQTVVLASRLARPIEGDGKGWPEPAHDGRLREIGSAVLQSRESP
jgi:hypothetical protein